MKKGPIGLLLVCVLVLSIVPAPATAQDTTYEDGGTSDGSAGDAEACRDTRSGYETARSEQEARHERERQELQAHQEAEWQDHHADGNATGHDAQNLTHHQEREWAELEERQTREREELDAHWRSRIEDTCSGDTPDADHGEYAAACEEATAAFREEREAFHAEQETEQRAFAEEQEARHRNFSKGNHTDAEWEEFQAEQEARWRAFQERQERAWSAWMREHAPQCESPEPEPGEERCQAPAEGNIAHVREDVEAEMERFHRAQKAKMERFSTEQQEAHHTFHQDGNHTDAEHDAFHQEQREAQHRLEEDLRADAQALEEELRSHWEERVEASAAACLPPGSHADADAGGHDLPPEGHPCRDEAATLKEERAAFELDLRRKAQAFHERQRQAMENLTRGNHTEEEARALHDRQEREAEAFYEAQMQERAGFEVRMKKAFRACMAETGEDSEHRLGNFTLEPQTEDRGRVSGSYVAFTMYRTSQYLHGFTVEGRTVFDAIGTDVTFREFDAEHAGSRVVMKGGDARLAVHDHPSGLLHLEARDGASFLLDPADDLDVTPREDGGVLLTGQELRGVLHVEDGRATLDNGTLEVTGKATFRLHAPNPVVGKASNQHRAEIDEAADEGHVGAEATVTKASDDGNTSQGTAGDEEDQAVESQVLPYRNVTLTVEDVRSDGSLSFRVSSDQEDPQTVIANLDDSLLEDVVAGNATVEVRYYEVAEDGTETPVEIGKASSVADVLDPTDDDGAPEYWVVVDEDGVQLLVSVPHWSEKRIQVQAVGTDAYGSEDVPLPGLAALLGAVALAAVSRRRR